MCVWRGSAVDAARAAQREMEGQRVTKLHDLKQPY